MKKNRNVTLSAVKRRGDLMDLKIIDLPADDAVLDIDDVKFLIGVKTTVLHVYGIARKLFYHRCC